MTSRPFSAMQNEFAAIAQKAAELRRALKYEELARLLEDALTTFPGHPLLLGQLGSANLHLGQPELAVDLLRQALPALRAVEPAAHLSLIQALKYDPRSDAAALRCAAEQWAQIFARPRALPPPARQTSRLRIGYVSPDFHRHPVASLIDGVLACHDQSTVDVYCYSVNRQTDDITERLRSHDVRWREIAGLSDFQAADVVRADGIDILIDISGHTNVRLSLFAERPAPMSINWILGGAATTGMAAIDYVIGDPYAIPPGHEAHYTEQVVRLPRCYFAYGPPDDAPAVAAPPCARTGSVTFGCFNSLEKINHSVIDTWAKILKHCATARLKFQNHGYDYASVTSRIRNSFANAGVDPARLEFKGRLRPPEFLASHAEIDIGLDPFPYAGGLTTCDSLWMGVPVVTLPAEGGYGRHGATILSNTGLDSYIAPTRNAYIDIAVGLASNVDALAALRNRLRPQLMSTPLCDVVALTRDLEALLWELWSRRSTT